MFIFFYFCDLIPVEPEANYFSRDAVAALQLNLETMFVKVFIILKEALHQFQNKVICHENDSV